MRAQIACISGLGDADHAPTRFFGLGPVGTTIGFIVMLGGVFWIAKKYGRR